MNYPRIILKKGRDASLRHGHPWLMVTVLDERCIDQYPDAPVIGLAKVGERLCAMAHRARAAGVLLARGRDGSLLALVPVVC